MPQSTVRQFTRRRSGEQAATMAMKHNAPAAACPRGPTVAPSNQDAAPSAMTAPMATSLSEPADLPDPCSVNEPSLALIPGPCFLLYPRDHEWPCRWWRVANGDGLLGQHARIAW